MLVEGGRPEDNLARAIDMIAEAGDRVQSLFLDGRRAEAVAAVPDELADEISLVGPPDRIRDRLAAWRESPVTTLLVGSRAPETLRLLADAALG